MMTTVMVRNIRVRTASTRRYLVVAVRPEALTTERGTYVAFARVQKRTDNLDTARTVARRYGHQQGAFAVVVDTRTGQEV